MVLEIDYKVVSRAKSGSEEVGVRVEEVRQGTENTQELFYGDVINIIMCSSKWTIH